MNVTQLDATEQISVFEPILRPKMPELDVLRGIASLSVFFYHGLYYARDFSLFTPIQRRILFAFSPGQFGVNLFFVLSGFLITGLLLDSRARLDYYRRFYVRRALRILPAYYAILLILVLTRTGSSPFLVMSMFYCANLSLLFGIKMSYPVLWSLAVEEQFYLVWPTVVHRITARWLAIVAGAIIIASPISRLVCFLGTQHANLSDSGCYYFTWNTIDGLACGALLAIAVREFCSDRRGLLRLSVLCMGLALMMALIGAPFGILTRQSKLGSALQAVPWNIGFTGIIGMVLLIGTSRRKSLVTSPVLIFFGSISYGLYMIHQLVFMGYSRFLVRVLPLSLGQPNSWPGVWVRLTIVGTVAVAISYLSRRYFEEPFLRLKDKLT
jgi:peptidoglycan/LPS O-acetylase OafA/YrhL